MALLSSFKLLDLNTMDLDLFSPSFFLQHNFGVVDVLGRDSAKFLQRISTNNIEGLEVGASCLTAFLNQKGRLVVVCYVRRVGKNAFRLIVPYDSAEKLTQWLEQYLFIEDVTLDDLSSQRALCWIIGEYQGQWDSTDVVIPVKASLVMPAKAGIQLCCTENAITMQERVINGNFRKLSEDEFESARIAALLPLSTNEISNSFHPIQLGLDDALHWAKGCYIGQEVISRLESQQKSGGTLAGMKMSEEDWRKLKVGETILSNGQPVGRLTSVAPLYFRNTANALAVLKRSDIVTALETDLSKVRIDSNGWCI